MEDGGVSDQDEPAASAPQPAARESDAAGGASSWIALVFVLVLLAGAVFVVNMIIRQVRLQDCVLSGRKDCVEITPSSTQ